MISYKHKTLSFVSWRHHIMEMLSTLLALCEGTHRSPVHSPHKEPVTWNFGVFFVVSLHKLLTPMISDTNIRPIKASCIDGFPYHSLQCHERNRSQITCLTIVCSNVYSGPDQRKYQSSASLAFVRGIHQGLVNSPHKWPVTRKMFPFDDVIMDTTNIMINTFSVQYTNQQMNTD